MMPINFMRFVDFWIGIPFCFLFSVLDLFLRILPFKRAPSQPKKILFIEVSEMGTAIVAYSSLKKAKSLYPQSELYFLIFDELQDSVHLLDIIPRKNVITLRSRSFFLFVYDTFRALIRCRREHIDTVIDLEFFSRFSAIFTYLSGAKRRVGFHRFHMEGLYRGNLMTHKVYYNPYVHTSQAYLPLVQALHFPSQEIPLLKHPVEPLDHIIAQHHRIQSTPAQKKVIWEKLKILAPKITEKHRLVIVNPNRSPLIPLRSWPLESYAALIKKILQDPSVYVIITGVSSEKANAQDICSLVQNSRCVDFTGQVNLRQLIDLYNISRMLITNDSGPAHFASLTPIEIFVFFGPETPVKYSPLTKNHHIFYTDFACSPCVSAYNGLHSPCSNNLCLQAIKVDGVYTQIKKSL